MASELKLRGKRRDAPIALLTDFGYRDHYAGVMRGVIASIAPRAVLIDISHGVPPQNICAGALILRESWRFFPSRSIFVVVVDPGVGTQRRAVAVQTHRGDILIGPDNGVLWLTVDEAGIRQAVEVRSPRYFLPHQSSTFHGRDIFAPTAAHLWNGATLTRLGPHVDDMERLALPKVMESGEELKGQVMYVDTYGNLVTNLARAAVESLRSRFPTRRLLVRIGGGVPIVVSRTYGDVPKRAPLALFGSFEMLEIAVREGNAAELLAAGPGAEIRVRAEP
jgi:S-adenosyl-L-methionine hydrolase (adenosine-forming)